MRRNGLFVQILIFAVDKLVLKSTQECKTLRTAKTILKKSRLGRLMLPDLKYDLNPAQPGVAWLV